MEEDTERQTGFEDVQYEKNPSEVKSIRISPLSDHALVSHTYSEVNEEQPVPPNVQCLVILQPTKKIPNELCYLHEQLRQIQLPAGLQHIGEKAFFGCCSLQEVALPFSIKSIGILAFDGCSSLVTVTQLLPDTEDRETKEANTVSRYKTLRKIVFNIAAGTNNKIDDAIWYQAFKGCTSLQSLVVPTNVKAIKERAFEDCHSLSEIDLPETLVQIQFCAFKSCTALKRIKIPSTVDVLASYLFLRCTALVDVTLAEGLKRIGNFAFAYCSALEKIRLPSTVKIIEKGAFSFCESLVSADLEGADADFQTKVFQDCSSLQRMTLPPVNKMLQSYTLCNCRHLVQITFSEGLIAIGQAALRNCQSLRSIALPKSLKRIHAHAMAGCTHLVSVEIPRGTKARLNRHAFQDCQALANIVVPPSMVKLILGDDGDAADTNFFSGCILLQLQYANYIHSRTRGSIFERLEDRFQNFPVHELCYYASSTTREELEKEVPKHIDTKNTRDAMGMTTFHVLLSASTRRLDLLEVLLDANPATGLLARDENGMSAVHYLTSNWTPDARVMMRKCLQKAVLDPLQNWGLEAWRKRMEQLVDATCSVAPHDGNHESLLETELINTTGRLSMYKRLEVTSLLEQWLWKLTLSCAENDGGEDGDANRRSICRAKCGASFIIPIVKTFLDDKNWETGF